MPYTGEIIQVTFDITPGNFLPCDGRLINISINPALFSLIGNKFGGDGSSNFGLPNYDSSAPRGSRYLICIGGDFPTTPLREE